MEGDEKSPRCTGNPSSNEAEPLHLPVGPPAAGQVRSAQYGGSADRSAELTLLYWRRVRSGCGLMLCMPVCSWAWASALLKTGLPEGRGVESPTFGIRATFCGYSGAVCGLMSPMSPLLAHSPNQQRTLHRLRRNACTTHRGCVYFCRKHVVGAGSRGPVVYHGMLAGRRWT